MSSHPAARLDRSSRAPSQLGGPAASTTASGHRAGVAWGALSRPRSRSPLLWQSRLGTAAAKLLLLGGAAVLLASWNTVALPRSSSPYPLLCGGRPGVSARWYRWPPVPCTPTLAFIIFCCPVVQRCMLRSTSLSLSYPYWSLGFSAVCCALLVGYTEATSPAPEPIKPPLPCQGRLIVRYSLHASVARK